MTAAAARKREGNGLRGMRERVEMLGGTLQPRHRSRNKAHHHAAAARSHTRRRRLRPLNHTVKDSTKEGRKTIRVVLAEDQGMVLGALAALLEIEDDISVVAQCA